MLLFLYGEDLWGMHSKLTQIKARFIKETDPSKLNLVTIVAGQHDSEQLRTQLRASPFLARKRLVVVQNFLTQTGKKDGLEIFRDTLPFLAESEQVIAVVIEEHDRPKKWKNAVAQGIWEFLEKHAQGEEFKPVWGAKLETAIMAQAKAHAVVLQKDAAVLLAIMSSGDLRFTEMELQKLDAYAAAREITATDVKFLCATQTEENIFEFLDALGTKDKKALVRTVEDQLQESEPLALINRATAHLRALLVKALAGETGLSALKLHPFQQKKISAQARHWTAPALKQVLFSLLELEYQTKRGRIPDAHTQLTALFARI